MCDLLKTLPNRKPKNGRENGYCASIAVVALCLMGLLTAMPALAGDCNINSNYPYYEVLLDIDGDTGTGGNVLVEQAGELPHPEPGIDTIVRAFADCIPGESMIITEVQALNWDGLIFSPLATDSTDYPIGLNNGFDGSDVVEWVSPIPSRPCVPRALFHSSMTQFNDYTDTVAIGDCSDSTLEIPTANSVGLGVLASLLALGGLLVVRRLGGSSGLAILLAVGAAASFAGVLWALTITPDGSVADWEGQPPLVIDPAGDQSNPLVTAEDLLACWADVNESNELALRCDVTNATDGLAPGEGPARTEVTE